MTKQHYGAIHSSGTFGGKPRWSKHGKGVQNMTYKVDPKTSYKWGEMGPL